jgi:sRNA-binding protein
VAYQYNRQEIESVIELLVELYPKCFYLDPEKRLPLKSGIVTDLVGDGVAMARELLRASIDWYESHFGYKFALQAGARRVDLHGEPVGTVTELEQRAALKYVHDRKLEKRERDREDEQRKRKGFSVEKISSPPIAKPPMMAQDIPMPKAPTPKVAKPPNTPLAPIQALLDATGAVYESQPESLRRHFVVAGLRALISETEKVIAALEGTDASLSGLD